MVPAGLDYIDTHYTPGPGAVVLPAENYNVSDVMQLTNQRISKWADENRREAAQKRQVAAKKLADLKLNPDKKILDEDRQHFVDAKREFEDLQTNANLNPDNPDYYENLRNSRDQINTEAVAATTAYERVAKAWEEYGRNPTKYKNPQANIDEYIKAGIGKRDNSKPLLEPDDFDANTFLNAQAKLVKPSTDSKVKRDPDIKGLYEVETTTKVDEEAIRKMTSGALDTSPKYRKYITDQWEALPQTGKDALTKIAQARTNAGDFITPDQILSNNQAELAYMETHGRYEYAQTKTGGLKFDPEYAAEAAAIGKSNAQTQFIGPDLDQWTAVYQGHPKAFTKLDDGTIESSDLIGLRFGDKFSNVATGKTETEVITGTRLNGQNPDGSNIILQKTNRSELEHPENPWFDASNLGPAFKKYVTYQYPPHDVPSLVHAANIVARNKHHMLNEKTGGYEPKSLQPQKYGEKEATIAYQNISTKQQKITEAQHKFDQETSIPKKAEAKQQLDALTKERDSAVQDFMKKHVHVVKTKAEYDKLAPGSFWSADGKEPFKQKK